MHATLGQRPGDFLAAPADRAWQPHFGLCLLLAWLAVVTQLLVQDWTLTATSMHDADDALRLVQLRSFIAGHGWFDLHEARFGPPVGYESHWSRLIDAGLAGLFFIFNAFVEHDMAERLMMAVWPVLWPIPAIGGAAAIAWRLAGREAALVLLVLAIFGMPAMGQFRPGRIDHHNVQIALAILAVAATVWSDRRRWAAYAAGAVTGLALAIGLESLNVLALCGIAFVLRFVIDHTAAPALRAYGFALAVTTVGAFLVTVAPDHWALSVCDALAVNTAAGVIVGGTGVALAAVWFGQAGLAVRCAVIATIAAITAAVYVGLEPRCLGGPYAMVDPAIFPIWFDNVGENQSLARGADLHRPVVDALASHRPWIPLHRVSEVGEVRNDDLRRNVDGEGARYGGHGSSLSLSGSTSRFDGRSPPCQIERPNVPVGPGRTRRSGLGRPLPCIHQIALPRVGALEDRWADDATRPAGGEDQGT